MSLENYSDQGFAALDTYHW